MQKYLVKEISRETNNKIESVSQSVRLKPAYQEDDESHRHRGCERQATATATRLYKQKP